MSRQAAKFHPTICVAVLPLSFALVFGTPGVARAGDTSGADRETARQLMDDGDKKLEAKNFDGAVASFRAAHELMHVPTTGIELARALRAAGKLIDARDVALDVYRSTPVAGENAAFKNARDESAVIADELGKKIPTLLVRLQGDTTGGKLWIDTKPIPTASWSLPRAVDPGQHLVEFESTGGRRVQQDVLVVAEEKKTIELRAENAGKVITSTPPIAAETKGATVMPASHGVPPAAIGAFVLGGVGLASGIVFGGFALSKASDVRTRCPGDVCPASTKDDRASAETLAWVSNISFGVALVGVGVGTVLLLTAPKKSVESARTIPLLAPLQNGGMIGVSHRF